MEEKPKIFVSYAKEQKNDLISKFVNTYLFQIQGDFNYWWDEDVNQRDEWDNQIEKELNESQLIIIFISDDYLSENKAYIHKKEIPKILIKFKEKKSFVLPIVLEGCKIWIESELNSAGINFFDKGEAITKDNYQLKFTEIIKKIRQEYKPFIEKEKSKHTIWDNKLSEHITNYLKEL
jgi:TIR domain